MFDPTFSELIRRYLEAGIMANGVIGAVRGHPQGGPLSPLLANVLLDEVDKELEQRGLSFVRYADDLNVYVGSWRAGEDAMETLPRLITRYPPEPTPVFLSRMVLGAVDPAARRICCIVFRGAGSLWYEQRTPRHQ